MNLKQIIVWIVVILVIAVALFLFISRNDSGIDSSSSNSANAVVPTPENIISSEIISENDDVSIGELI